MNYCSLYFVEGVWWIGLGIWTALHYGALKRPAASHASNEPSGRRIESGTTKRGPTKAYSILLAIILIFFGISDFVEMVTGAWWQPWWLLVWKSLCIVLGIISIILINNERRRP